MSPMLISAKLNVDKHPSAWTGCLICAKFSRHQQNILNGADSSAGDYLRNETMLMLEGCSTEKVRLIS
jgi:hypothetical protein